MYDNILETIITALNHNNAAAPRTMQSREGILGPSDIGFCRQKAVLVTRQTPPSDETNKWAANVGTAIHNYVEAALKTSHPDWIMGSIDDLVVTATLPSGASISGHPDIVIPKANILIDIKTVDGFAWVKRNGTSLSHKYQRHLYALGAIQQGILVEDNLKVGNLYFDRSGKEQRPILILNDYDPSLTAEIDTWIGDVIYAVKQGEDSARDVAASVCAQICEFYTVCRGGHLPVGDGQDVIDDDELLKAIESYVEAREQEKQAAALKKEASYRLAGVNGIGNGYQVRWVTVAATKIDSYERAESTRLDVKKMKVS